MYKILLDDQLFYDPRVEELEILDPQLKIGLNKSGTFEFYIVDEHPYYDQIFKLRSIVKVYRHDTLLFKGRVLDDDVDMYNVKKIVCEGVLSYLNDSVVRPYVHQGSVREYLEFLIDQHNDQMSDDDHKRFEVGEITVTDPNDYIYRAASSYPNTLDEIQEKLVDSLGGYLIIKDDGETMTLDYLADSPYQSSQKIEFGKNLIDIRRFTRSEDVATAIIPLGATLDDDESEDLENRLTIESVNGGKDYVYDETARQIFGGLIFKTIIFDDVTIPSNLMTRGLNALTESVNLGLTIELNAFDMNTLDINIDDIRLFDYIAVESAPHGLNTTFLVRDLDLHLTEPGNNLLSVGKKIDYLTSNQQKTDRKVNQIDSDVSRVTSTARQVRQSTETISENLTDINNRVLNYWQVNNINGLTPNMVAGNTNNYIPNSLTGAKIGGGGTNSEPNDIVGFGDHAVIAGGQNNSITESHSVISGGSKNGVYGSRSVISGGHDNIVTSEKGSVAGGQKNQVHAEGAVVSGGEENGAYGDHSTVGGGYNNEVYSAYATVSGGEGNRATNIQTTVGGGLNNNAIGDYATIAGGRQNEAPGTDAVISGGRQNLTASTHSTVSGGKNNQAVGEGSTVSGGELNQANSKYTHVAGGYNNHANHDYTSAKGQGARAFLFNSDAHGGGSYADGSSTQTLRSFFKRVTTNNTERVLGFNHTDASMSGYELLFVHTLDFKVIAQSLDGVAKVWTVTTSIANLGSGLEILGQPIINVVGQSQSAVDWTVNFELVELTPGDVLSRRTQLKIKGDPSKTVNWSAHLEILELLSSSDQGISDPVITN